LIDKIFIMSSKNFITSQGSVLNNFSYNKAFFYLKKDPQNHNFWKNNKKTNLGSSITSLKNFKNRFLKK